MAKSQTIHEYEQLENPTLAEARKAQVERSETGKLNLPQKVVAFLPGALMVAGAVYNAATGGVKSLVSNVTTGLLATGGALWSYLNYKEYKHKNHKEADTEILKIDNTLLHRAVAENHQNIANLEATQKGLPAITNEDYAAMRAAKEQRVAVGTHTATHGKQSAESQHTAETAELAI